MHACLLLFLLIGAVERGEVEFRPTTAESNVPKRFQLKQETFSYEKRLLRETPRYRVWNVRFPSPIVTNDVTNDMVSGDYFEPIETLKPGRKRSGVVVLHILGADFALSRYLAARLADRGVAALFIRLPYYGERRAPRARNRFISTDIERSISAMLQGICDVRAPALGWRVVRRSTRKKSA